MKIIAFFFLLLSQMAFAEDCLNSLSAPLVSDENSRTLNLALNIINPTVRFCISEDELNSDFDMMRAFNTIKSESPYLVKNNCINIGRLKTHQKEIDILLKQARGDEARFAVAFSKNNPEEIYLTSGKKINRDSYFKGKESLFGSEIIVNPVYGILLAKEAYKGQADKKTHAIYGAGISIGSTLVGGLIIDEMDYSSSTKKTLMKAVGPLSGLVVGILKEVLYDSKRKNKHTVDAHDAIATGVGAGMIPISMSFTF